MEKDKLFITGLSYAEFDPNLTLPNSTYIVSSIHIVNTTILLASNVTLIFVGGKITGNGTLEGNNTVLVAPISQIFSADLNIIGSWIMERAYPQWFGAVAGSMDDCSDAINKAIKMKLTGEVFIPRGRYLIRNILHVKYGIQLVGESGMENKSERELGTFLVADMNNPSLLVEDSSFTNGYVVEVNVKDWYVKDGEKICNWEILYSSNKTQISRILFSNNISKLKAIFSAASCCEISACTFNNFQQSVVFSNHHYIDRKKVADCVISNDANIHRGESLYTIDFGFLGDGLVCEYNSINNGSFNKGIRVSACLGGNITSNIINADVIIGGCKGISFDSNHMEDGQIIIRDSNIGVRNNFFKKISKPNVIVQSSANFDTPVVDMQANMFLFYDKEVNDQSDYSVDEICEYDIQLANMSVDGDMIQILNISQNYRYWVLSGTIGKMYTCGITLCDKDELPIQRFNEHSYLLSQSSSVFPWGYVNKSGYVDDLRSIYITLIGYSKYTTWNMADGEYFYKGHAVWDNQRKICNPIKELGRYTLKKNAQGLLLAIGNGMSCGHTCSFRLYRGRKDSGNVRYTHYVDVPICGTQYLYENGISICGFRWKELTDGLMVGNADIESICYKGKNIECKAPSSPTFGIWQNGDIVYNTGNSSYALWIRVNDKWVQR